MRHRVMLVVVVALSTLAPGLLLAVPQDPVVVEEFAIPATDDGLPGVGPIRRYGWFKRLWESKRSGWSQRVAADQGAVVFLGDSITQGWGDTFKGSFGDLKVANRGISGDTTRGMLIRVDADVVALNPRGVVLLMGTNDLEEGATPEQVVHNIKLIIQTLKEYDVQIPIVTCLVFPSSATKKRPSAQIKRVNELIRSAVYGDPQITVVDTWTLFANEEGDAKSEEFPDLLHPNDLGYAKWAAALKPIFATLEFLETETDTFQPEAGFKTLFNGTDLSGWCLLPTTEAMLQQRVRWRARQPDAPPWPVVKERVELDGKSSTEDGRYVAKHGRLIVTTPSEGRRIQQLWTSQEFPEDFVLRLQFRATPNADSGVFLRGKQLQCRDFPLAGPYKDLKNYRAGGWNDLEVRVTGTTAHCSCNGEVIEAALMIPETGPIGLEGDRGQIEYRRIRISE